jgi:peptidoglycan/xylan/chitin deacetylase (PgdA/CDA1 family)
MRFVLLVLALLHLPLRAQDRRVVITVDDLPCANCADGTWTSVNERIVAALRYRNVPAIGFVNAGKLEREGRLDSARLQILQRWIDAGLELGNHTFAHRGANIPLAEYEADVRDGERYLRALVETGGGTLRYFRHPFLQTGPRPGYRDSLNLLLMGMGYTVAPVTFDNDEWMLAYCYEHAKRANDTAALDSLASEYLHYMDTAMRFHEAQAEAFLGRTIPHVLLVHSNTLNADHLGALLDGLSARGYRFITLEEALRDVAYELPEQHTRHGFSWIRRWQLAAGMKPPWMPELSQYVQRRYMVLQQP